MVSQIYLTNAFFYLFKTIKNDTFAKGKSFFSKITKQHEKKQLVGNRFNCFASENG
jgi:hypothetical protein